jgi:MFS family permease
MLGAALTAGTFVFVSLTTDLWVIRSLLFLRGFAMGFTFVAVQAASYARIVPADNGRASAIFSTQRQMAVSLGIALMSTILASFAPLGRVPDDPVEALTGYRWAFAAATGLALIAAALATRIRDEDAAATMQRAAR